MRKFSKIATSALLAGAALSYASSATAVPRTAFVHLFEWSWQDVATECETFLGPKGFAAVQVSPPNEGVDNPAWWARYQPVSYRFNSRSGNREQFQDMVQRCKASGVDIYVDAVINHMAAWDRYFPDVPYGTNDFNSCTREIDYGNRWQVQYCDLVGLNDLKTSSDYVRQKIADYMNDATSMGVAGFRIDAAKHIPAEDIAAIKSKLNGNPYLFQEVIGAGGEPIRPTEYTYNGNVTEFAFARQIGPAFRNSNIAWLRNLSSSMELASADAVTFVTNHDEERHNPNGPIWHGTAGDGYFLANIFTLAYPYGYPKIMSGYYFNGDFDAGPPSTGVHTGNACGFDGGDWVCEHKWRGVANMVAFRNHTAAQWQLTNWWDNGNDQIAFGRGGLGFVVINKRADGTLEQDLNTGMADGDYCNIIEANFDETSGECIVSADAKGPGVITVSGGMAHFSVSGDNAAAIHVGAKIEPCTGDDCGCSGSACLTPVTASTICYDNAAQFNSPSLYYWGAQPLGSLADANWPGVSMQKNGSFYCHDLGASLSRVNVIFSDNGAKQTADLTVAGASCYQGGQWKSLTDCGFIVTDQPVGGSEVCYDNQVGFTNPSIYYWSVQAEMVVNDVQWPGTAMQQKGNYYCYDFGTPLSHLNVIFSDNGANQSSDLSTDGDALCYASGSWVASSYCSD
ncbi:starch-binding protein [Agarivorans sp. QJM3NY_33]|uniref:starch-binding protein n=1 Tax=Agarivorans sp. QJM3NY_33 TaxID=3421432 RepID=UPI003D7EDF07